jgi:predicted Zn finger-like uncharacterized protein
MILTCPSCGTQYVVKDDAIPPGGRQVRCKACSHSWRQVPAGASQDEQLDEPYETQVPEDPAPEEALPEAGPDVAEDAAADALPEDEYPGYGEPAIDAGASESPSEEPATDEGALAEAPAPAAIPPETEITGMAEAAPSGRLEWTQDDDEFSPFAKRETAEAKPRGRWLLIGLLVLLIAAAIAGFWFFAPLELRQKLGLATASETPLQLMLTHSDRTPLESGNDYLNISGRVINPTDKQQPVPPIHAQLQDSSGKVVYSWTIPPPAKSIPPRGSTSFNSAELNIPAAAQDLTVTLGEPKA